MSGSDSLRTLRPWRLALAALLEPAVRLAGWMGRLIGRDDDGTEMALRGRLLGGEYAWKVGRRVRFVGPCGRFQFGEDVCFFGDTYVNANGPEGFVRIGHHSHIDHNAVLYGQGGLTIGAECAIASGVLIYSQTNMDSLKDGSPVTRQPVLYSRVEIGNGCWLGAGVRILPGVSLGEGCHVGAGAVVVTSSDCHTVLVGVPARPLRRLDQ